MSRREPLRLRFWLRAMDITAALFGFGSRVYLWALQRAADATDWSER